MGRFLPLLMLLRYYQKQALSNSFQRNVDAMSVTGPPAMVQWKVAHERLP